jgi:hypothetical protein
MWANLSRGNRIAIVVVAIMAVLLALALYGYLSGGWDNDEHSGLDFMLASTQSRAETAPPCVADDATRERIRVIMTDALDDALHDQIKHLFGVWMKDDRGQPERARVGAYQAIRGYHGVRKGVVEWAPTICP